jgi:hypothetical protein
MNCANEVFFYLIVLGVKARRPLPYAGAGGAERAAPFLIGEKKNKTTICLSKAKSRRPINCGA